MDLDAHLRFFFSSENARVMFIVSYPLLYQQKSVTALAVVQSKKNRLLTTSWESTQCRQVTQSCAVNLYQYFFMHRPGAKRKPSCISVLKMISLSCTRVLVSTKSAGRGWCKSLLRRSDTSHMTTTSIVFIVYSGLLTLIYLGNNKQ